MSLSAFTWFTAPGPSVATVATVAVFASFCKPSVIVIIIIFVIIFLFIFPRFFRFCSMRARVCVCDDNALSSRGPSNSDEGDTSSSSSSENEGKISYRDYEGPCCQPLLIVPPSSPVLPDKMNANKKVGKCRPSVCPSTVPGVIVFINDFNSIFHS